MKTRFKSAFLALNLILTFIFFHCLSIAQTIFSTNIVGEYIEVVLKDGKKLSGTVTEVSDTSIVLYKLKEYTTLNTSLIVSYELKKETSEANRENDYYYFSTPSAFPLTKRECRTRGPMLAFNVWDYGLTNKLTWHFGTLLGIGYGTGLSLRLPINKDQGIVFSGAAFAFLPYDAIGGIYSRVGYSIRAGKNDFTLSYSFGTDLDDFIHLPSLSYRRKLDSKNYLIAESFPVYVSNILIYFNHVSFRIATRRMNYWQYGLVAVTTENFFNNNNRIKTFPMPTIGYHCVIQQKNN